jgi:hypothetical protein
MVVDCTETFPAEMRGELESFGADMWEFRKRTDGNPTTRAVNCYDGEKRE